MFKNALRKIILQNGTHILRKAFFRHALVNNAFKTVQQNMKDKENICKRADAQQRYLTQDFIL